MTINTDLTANELRAALVLVKSCLDGMGGDRPSDLEHDEYTWVSAKDLQANGWNKNEATGTFGALMEKGFIDVMSKNEWALSTEAWQWLDTVWDAHLGVEDDAAQEEAFAQGEEAKLLEAIVDQPEDHRLTVRQLINEIWKPGKIRMPVLVSGDVTHIVVEKADLERKLREYADLDVPAPWAFLPSGEGDTERFLDTQDDN